MKILNRNFDFENSLFKFGLRSKAHPNSDTEFSNKINQNQNSKFSKNKKGSNKLISIYWFAILVIIAGGVVMMVNVFYSSPYDVREAEAEILSAKVADCLVKGGEINKLLTSPTGAFRESFKDNFMKFCSLNFDVEGEFERPEYYVEVGFYTEGDLEREKFKLIEGNLNWKKDCNFKDKNQEKLVKCVENDFYAVDSTQGVYLIKILSIVGKSDQNVK